MASVIPRSLNDPVGLAPSTFNHTWAPTRADSRGAFSSGVPPSSRLTTGVCAPTGRCSLYSSMTPRHATGALKGPPVSSMAHDPDQAADAPDAVELAQFVQAGLHVPLERGVGD